MAFISPLAPKIFPQLPEINGIKMLSTSAKIKPSGKNDVLIIKFKPGSSVAGVFTTSYTAGSNIKYCRSILSHGYASVLIVNSGNANVAVGEEGDKAIQEIVNTCSKEFSCPSEEVYFSSTGIIGQVLPTKNIISVIIDSERKMNSTGWREAAMAITTTDTYPKMVTKQTNIGGVNVTINGICKGSGMIAPNMATMLAYIFTDASINSNIMQKLLNEYTEISFNSITVEGDMSTSDTVLMFATNVVKHPKVISHNDNIISDFKVALKNLMIEMAHLIVKDGEGAQKFITISIENVVSEKVAKKLALSVANSPLVKTAIAGENPNWGRIIMALGKAEEAFDQNKISVKIGDEFIFKKGTLYTNCNMERINNHMQGSEIKITIDMDYGNKKAVVWTCDLTHKFIDINSLYST
ncbi:bifunctional glutamate N-acetyltransferase/amino-acid acetyltransferase ArgJ [Neoehrlichia mikurensis]|uniref:Arginine biosynthesis bifunctional protein ArgJ n=1 Tax=Neoehrlichia mikurensis TaxID=89586 RepID=A0A9Q9F4V4_9RICK|nr:bifunctional glutamate N-acetyltransferase/amino-acid acetyltransferase ArgJ [Neoehrlichia mikurensis]QXK91965.1 bifunctional glutamate N-acetyltransferase/amino-acid acetyltransferase ArgJ [Neoehrlichia mikurensis]QXK93179.1 bifunctional glutamate N-acetyltransferase/amino-acid acetyltransferase ArgJ [Neoehrlichia mikurensis]QXK93657.1 bifunctional glutamate N-acetyltransferase/amino-acid acetyltransferase ArgJ [Neoehrlichia mikurensis]UTO55386.1 bifunctional glutamate N-acetyltransferase/a